MHFAQIFYNPSVFLLKPFRNSTEFFSSVLRVYRTLVDSCLRDPGDPRSASLDPGRSHSRQVGCSASLDLGRSHSPQLCCSILLVRFGVDASQDPLRTWSSDDVIQLQPVWIKARVKLFSAILFCAPRPVIYLLCDWTLAGNTLVRYLFCILDSRDLQLLPIWILAEVTLLRWMLCDPVDSHAASLDLGRSHSPQ